MSNKIFNDEIEEILKQPDDEVGLLDVTLNSSDFLQKSISRKGYRFSLLDLDPEFSQKVVTVLSNCEDRNITMVPHSGIRTPWEQARLWRQSRSTNVVQAAIKRLEDGGASFLAKVLNDVGPIPKGPNITNALPGYSWHQWGEAVDSYWRVGGKAEWNDLKGYKIYAEEAKKVGLTAGGYWHSLKDWPHIQKRTSSPGRIYSMQEIDSKMRDLYENETLF